MLGHPAPPLSLEHKELFFVVVALIPQHWPYFHKISFRDGKVWKCAFTKLSGGPASGILTGLHTFPSSVLEEPRTDTKRLVMAAFSLLAQFT